MKKYSIVFLLLTVLMSFQVVTKKSAQTKPLQAPKPALANDLKSSVDRGKMVYLRRCLACHQVDGGGVPHLNAPLDGATQVVGKDKARIIKIVLNGFSDKVELDGEVYSNNMLPQKDMTDQEIADVLTYARNSWTNKASAVSVAEVKAVRAKIK